MIREDVAAVVDLVSKSASEDGVEKQGITPSSVPSLLLWILCLRCVGNELHGHQRAVLPALVLQKALL